MKKIVKLTESDLVKIVKRVLKEQGVLGTLGSRSAFNLSKSSPTEVPAGRTPQVQDDPRGVNTECYQKNINNLVNACKRNESKYVPDKDAKYIAEQLRDEMEGLGIYHMDIYSTLDYLKNDTPKFCRVSNAFNFNNENLAQWFEDELTLLPDLVWGKLENHGRNLNIGDACSTAS
jgi:hypothetical protein